MTEAVRVRTSKRPRAGRRFEPVQELELRSDALCAARSLPGAYRGLLVLQEVAGPFGIPDFLCVVGGERAMTGRIALEVPPMLNEIDAGIVAVAAPRAGSTMGDFAGQLGWPIASIERRVKGLLRTGALIEAQPERFVRPAALQPTGRLYAIETKVRDWGRALRQARSYRLWCDNYVIVMPSLSPTVLPEAIASVVSDAGGLYVASGWAQRPRARELSAARRLWASEHVVAAIRGMDLPAFGGSKGP